ncbi:MAG TPA: UDP-N-acetylglucosamine 1-carboxyvinyltransferase [Clostridia bacterium]|nr:UDP-N-acetylglucosamine 1-carboxyvinyltransferase [Clostridia bacterium]
MQLEKFIIKNNGPLLGRVKVNGAKNAVLPIMAATLLTNEICYLENVPDLRDVKVMKEVITHFGGEFIDISKNEKSIRVRKISTSEAPYELVQKMRASFFVMGPLLAKTGVARVSLPGGCAIGARPVDLHLKGFAALGAEISQGQGYIEAKADELIGSTIYLDFPSVGATENIMMAAVLAKGETIIENAAEEPEIIDLSNFLNKMGANVRGAGTDTIRIEGVENLKGTRHEIIPDRIETGTYMVAAAITKGDVVIENIVPAHIKPVIAKLKETGAELEIGEDVIRVNASNISESVDLTTLPYPGFPTDMQAQFMALMTILNGTSVINETVFENRFMHIPELARLGANIRIEGHSAIVRGVSELEGSEVVATDLRAGAALVLAGLVAKGETHVNSIYHIDRGYSNLESNLRKLGADIKRVTVEEINQE